MAGTAFFRHSIPYEVFYGVHFLFLAMYAIAVGEYVVRDDSTFSSPSICTSHRCFHYNNNYSTYDWRWSEEREERQEPNVQVVRCPPHILSLWLCNDVVQPEVRVHGVSIFIFNYWKLNWLLTCSSSLILCLCVTPLPSHRFKTRVTSFTTVEGHEGSKMLILKMKRPSLFMFQPGQ